MANSALVAAVVMLAAAAAPPAEEGPVYFADYANRETWPTVASPEDIARAYPRKARAAGVKGQVVLGCDVFTDGSLRACRIEQETPPGLGFGKAALKLGRKYSRAPDPTADGPPAKAGVVHLPISFSP